MQSINSAESVGSNNIGVRIHDSRETAQLRAENERLRALLHDSVARGTFHQQDAERRALDAARWHFAKQKYCAELGFETPIALQRRVDADMRSSGITFHDFAQPQK